MKKALVSTVAAVLLLMVVTGLVSAAPTAAPGATPFKGTFRGVEIGTPEFPTLHVSGSGSGNATHLGAYTVIYTAEVNIPTAHANAVTAHFTAANGDQLFAAGEGQGIVHGDFNTITEELTITGGTGRFAGATGSYTLIRELNRPTGESSGEFTGTLVMPTGG